MIFAFIILLIAVKGFVMKKVYLRNYPCEMRVEIPSYGVLSSEDKQIINSLFDNNRVVARSGVTDGTRWYNIGSGYQYYNNMDFMYWTQYWLCDLDYYDESKIEYYNVSYNQRFTTASVYLYILKQRIEGFNPINPIKKSTNIVENSEWYKAFKAKADALKDLIDHPEKRFENKNNNIKGGLSKEGEKEGEDEPAWVVDEETGIVSREIVIHEDKQDLDIDRVEKYIPIEIKFYVNGELNTDESIKPCMLVDDNGDFIVNNYDEHYHDIDCKLNKKVSDDSEFPNWIYDTNTLRDLSKNHVVIAYDAPMVACLLSKDRSALEALYVMNYEEVIDEPPSEYWYRKIPKGSYKIGRLNGCDGRVLNASGDALIDFDEVFGAGEHSISSDALLFAVFNPTKLGATVVSGAMKLPFQNQILSSVSPKVGDSGGDKSGVKYPLPISDLNMTSVLMQPYCNLDYINYDNAHFLSTSSRYPDNGLTLDGSSLELPYFDYVINNVSATDYSEGDAHLNIVLCFKEDGYPNNHYTLGETDSNNLVCGYWTEGKSEEFISTPQNVSAWIVDLMTFPYFVNGGDDGGDDDVIPSGCIEVTGALKIQLPKFALADSYDDYRSYERSVITSLTIGKTSAVVDYSRQDFDNGGYTDSYGYNEDSDGTYEYATLFNHGVRFVINDTPYELVKIKTFDSNKTNYVLNDSDGCLYNSSDASTSVTAYVKELSQETIEADALADSVIRLYMDKSNLSYYTYQSYVDDWTYYGQAGITRNFGGSKQEAHKHQLYLDKNRTQAFTPESGMNYNLCRVDSFGYCKLNVVVGGGLAQSVSEMPYTLNNNTCAEMQSDGRIWIGIGSNRDNYTGYKVFYYLPVSK